MATEPVSGVLAGILLKFAPLAALGAIGGAIMAIFDPPATRRGLFLQATAAGTGSLVFGKLAVLAAARYLPFPAADLEFPMYFLVGAMSWGLFGALAKLRQIVSNKAAEKVADKLGL